MSEAQMAAARALLCDHPDMTSEARKQLGCPSKGLETWVIVLIALAAIGCCASALAAAAFFYFQRKKKSAGGPNVVVA
ncbi:unnamed protein product [Caenorhabditis sp. 36 PRJEB53466]|nr:unnamed protein product [Caenorhabditis sp. 36 PRJEB53466]